MTSEARNEGSLRRLVRRWWYTAKVENHAGVHGVFYSTTRPTIGAACPGIAGPNRIVGYRRELAPNDKAQF
jgi:hypothetical protein